MGMALDWLGVSGCLSVAMELVPDYDLKRSTESVMWAPCPFHVEQNPSLRYEAEKDLFYCFGCQAGGDLIDMFSQLNGLNESDGYIRFRDTYAPDQGDGTYRPVKKSTPRRKQGGWAPKTIAQPVNQWQEHADKFVRACAENMQKTPSLLNEFAWRGISPDTAYRCLFGWNARDQYRPVTSWGLPYARNDQGKEAKIWLPAGLIIPSYRNGRIQKIKIRRSDTTRGPAKLRDLKYYEVTGSASEGYNVYGRPRAGFPLVVIIVETERDGGLLWQELHSIGFVAMATAGAGKRPDAYAHEILRRADCILLAFDTDAAGAKNWQSFWQPEYPQAIRLLTPRRYGKDVGDAVWPLPLRSTPTEFSAETTLDRMYRRLLSSFYLDLRGWAWFRLPKFVRRGITEALADSAQRVVSPQQKTSSTPVGWDQLVELVQQCGRVTLISTDSDLGMECPRCCSRRSTCELIPSIEAAWVHAENCEELWQYVAEEHGGRYAA